MCSERPITICPIVKSWTHAWSHRSGISVRSRGNKDQSGLLYKLHYRETWPPSSAGHAQSINFEQLAAISWHWLRLACSGWPAGFESTGDCLWSSKVWGVMALLRTHIFRNFWLNLSFKPWRLLCLYPLQNNSENRVRHSQGPRGICP